MLVLSLLPARGRRWPEGPDEGLAARRTCPTPAPPRRIRVPFHPPRRPRTPSATCPGIRRRPAARNRAV